MADKLEIRLGGVIGGHSVSTSDLDFSELKPLVERLEAAAIVEGGLDIVTKQEKGAGKQLRPLSPVRLALAEAYTEDAKPGQTAVYQFAVGKEAGPAVARITAGLAGQSGAELVPEAAEHVRKGLFRPIRRGLSVQLINGQTTPVFTASNPPPQLKVQPTRKFDTQIAVHILRVGGKRRLARVKLLGSGQEATVELRSEKLARLFGNHLYRDAVLKGSSTWVIDPNRFSAPTRLVQFVVTGHTLLDPVPMETVIEEMTEATGGIWDGVDPTDPEQVDDPPGSSGDLP